MIGTQLRTAYVNYMRQHPDVVKADAEQQAKAQIEAAGTPPFAPYIKEGKWLPDTAENSNDCCCRLEEGKRNLRGGICRNE